MKTLLPAFLAVFGLAATSAQAQDKNDLVVLRDGSTREGTIARETPTEVRLKMGKGNETTIPVGDIARIDYYDAPDVMRGIHAKLDDMKYNMVLDNLKEAENWAAELKNAKNKKRRDLLPRSWFDAAVPYYRALCLKELDNPAEALKLIDQLLTEHAKSRFVKQAYEWKVECQLAAGDPKAAEATIKEIQALTSQLGGDLVFRAQLSQARHLYEKGKYNEAQKIYDNLDSNSDKRVSSIATRGAIDCRNKSGNASALQTYCEAILRSSRANGPRLLATAALGDSNFRQKNYSAAVSNYVDAVVLYHPGTGSELVPEHERALYQLGQTYDQLHEKQAKKKQKLYYARAALSSFRELTVVYATGNHSVDAIAAIADLEKAIRGITKKK